MKRLISVLSFLVIALNVASQDLKSDIKQLYLNLPITDSIEGVINGKFGYSFEQIDLILPLPNTGLKSTNYVSEFTNHPLFNGASGEITITKMQNSDSIWFVISLIIKLSSIDEQFDYFDKVFKIFDKYSVKTNTYETLTEYNLVEMKSSSLDFEKEIKSNKLNLSLVVRPKKEKIYNLHIGYRIK